MARRDGQLPGLLLDFGAGVGHQHRTDVAAENRQVVAAVPGKEHLIVVVIELLLQELDTVQLGGVFRKDIEQADLLQVVDTPDQTGGHAEIRNGVPYARHHRHPVQSEIQVVAQFEAVLLRLFLQRQLANRAQRPFQLGMGPATPINGDLRLPPAHNPPVAVDDPVNPAADIGDGIVGFRQGIVSNRLSHQLPMAAGDIDQADLRPAAERRERRPRGRVLRLVAVGDHRAIHVGAEQQAPRAHGSNSGRASRGSRQAPKKS